MLTRTPSYLRSPPAVPAPGVPGSERRVLGSRRTLPGREQDWFLGFEKTQVCHAGRLTRRCVKLLAEGFPGRVEPRARAPVWMCPCVPVSAQAGVGPADLSPRGQFPRPGWHFASHLAGVGGPQRLTGAGGAAVGRPAGAVGIPRGRNPAKGSTPGSAGQGCHHPSASLTKPDSSPRGQARLRLRALGSRRVRVSLRLPSPSGAG